MDNIDPAGMLSSLAEGDSPIGDAVSKLLARPDLIMNLASELGISQNDDRTKNNTSKENDQNDHNSQGGDNRPQQRSDDHPTDKKKLLLALRPYMSEKRREALDMMINLESIGQLVGNIDLSSITKLIGGGDK